MVRAVERIADGRKIARPAEEVLALPREFAHVQAMTRSIRACALGTMLVLMPLACLAAAPDQDTTTLSLSVTGRASHAPDAMYAELEAVGRAAHAAAAQATVNRMMTAALHQTDRIRGLVATTGFYSVTPANQDQTEWIARQSLILRFDAAPDADAAAPVRALLGRLQQSGMQLQSLDGRLSAKTASVTRDHAIEDAASRLHADAERVAKALGETVGPIRSVQLGSQMIRPVFSTMALKAQAVAPIARPGPIEERVSLSATIVLRHPPP